MSEQLSGNSGQLELSGNSGQLSEKAYVPWEEENFVPFGVLLEKAKREERESIIKLLEERHQQLMELMEESADDDGFDVSWYITQEETVSKCIALIKGENK